MPPIDWTPTVLTPGIYPELSDQYQGRRLTPTKALSYSGIKILLEQTPADFIAPPKPRTDEMSFGLIVHKMALGKGERFEISPFDDYRSKAAREWKDDCIASGGIPIKAGKYDDAKIMADIIIERIKRSLNGAAYLTEVPAFWQEGDTWFSMMMDVWAPEIHTVIDPKTTGNVHQFDREITKFGYHIQSALYRRGLDKIRPEHAGRHQLKLLPIATEAPFTSRLISISEGWRTGAEMDIERATRTFNECMATGIWPGYPDEEVMDEPSWQMKLRMDREFADEGEE